MSEGMDEEYKPTMQQLRARTEKKRDRPIRVTRTIKDYKEEVTISDSEEESTVEPSEGGVEGISRGRVDQRRWNRVVSETPSEQSSRSGLSWSPHTFEVKTEQVISTLQEVRSQLAEARMAQPADNSMAEMLKIIMEMNARDKQDRDRREDERREEDARREERRERREQVLREDAERREAKLLIALKEASPAVPQTVHIESTKLPKMSEGEDLASFIELFETAMLDNRVPPEQWKAKIHAALDSKTKLKVRDTITDVHSAYDELKNALVGCGDLSFSHASESLVTGKRWEALKLPIRQAIQVWQRLFEKVTAEATTIREACTYSAVAVARYNANNKLKTYLDMKGDFGKEMFCRNVDEWLATKPLGVSWAKVKETLGHVQDRQNSNGPGWKPGQGKRV